VRCAQEWDFFNPPFFFDLIAGHSPSSFFCFRCEERILNLLPVFPSLACFEDRPLPGLGQHSKTLT